MNAEELRKIRKEREWTQQDIGLVIGVNRNVVTKWELGLHRIPHVVERFLSILTDPQVPRDALYWMDYEAPGTNRRVAARIATRKTIDASLAAQKGRTPQRQSKRIAGHVQPAARR